ncbi:MAG: CsbD family protein [Sinobacteraceae bacterium]|nr:CsbD family protein [Nevskiaceae bacterium]MBV8855296.1 CsbD family protein [Nevskiaceae bacterium]MBV9911182.1 CsbD family protein [Nevskiaceae bacterium]
MNQNQTDGMGKTVKGAVKEGTSKLTGNKLGEAEGKLEKNIGKAQTKLGDKQSEKEDSNPPR